MNLEMNPEITRKRPGPKLKRAWLKHPNAPKKAHTAYILFGIANRKNVIEDLTRTNQKYPLSSEIVRELSLRWSKLSRDKKKGFEDESNVQKIKYKQEKVAWMQTKEAKEFYNLKNVAKIEKLRVQKVGKTEKLKVDEKKLKLRIKGEEYFERVSLPRLTYKGLEKIIKKKFQTMQNIESIINLPNVIVNKNEDIVLLPEDSELEITFSK